MAVLGRLLVSSAERLDLPDLLSLDSYAAGDWKYFLKGLVGDSKPYILKGFDVIDPLNAIGTQSCSIRVAESVVFYPGSNAGGFFHGLQEGHAQATPLVPELRKNAVNYVYLTFSTFNTSVDTRAFWDPDKDGGVGGEFTQDVNTESVLKVEINVSTGSFPANTIPVAKVTVGPVVITAIEDARDLMFRLGSGGINPNPFNTYAWRSLPGSPYQRSEPPTQMQAGGVNPFQGADKNILTLKEWMDAVMSKLRELGGTTYWYDDTSSFSIITNFYDAIATAFKSKGKWVHDTTTPGLLTWTEDIQIKMTSDPRTYIIRQGSKTLADEQVMYIPMERNLPINATDENVQWTNSQLYVNTIGGAVGLFANLSKGDYIKKANDTIDKWVRVEEFYDAVNLGGSTTTAANARSVRLGSVYLGNTGPEKGRYDKGVYVAADLTVSDRNDAAIANTGGNFHWMALRSDTIENVGNAVTTNLSVAISEHDGSTAKITATAHGLVDGDRVTISGTTNFNGTYQVEVETANIFYINVSGGPFADESGAGHYAVITTAARTSPYGFQEESANHGFNSDDTIIIAGTTNYNGSFKINVRNATSFNIPMAAAAATETTGTATLARVIVRTEGAVTQLIQGQVINIGGSVADNIRQYIGMGSLSETAPNYTIPVDYNTIDGMQNYNGVVNENLTARIAKLTAMMADKAQDKTIKFLVSAGITAISNTTNASAQELRFSPDGSSVTIATPSSTGQAFVALPGSATPVSLLVNQAAYVQIDRNNTSSPSIQVANITSVPLEENTFIIAVRLNTPNIYLWDGSLITVGSQPAPNYLSTVVVQNQAMKLVEGGTWSWNSGTNTLTWSATAYVQIVGLANSVNQISAGSVALTTGQVAYVDINRTSPGGTLTVNVATNSSLTGTADRLVIARRESAGTDVIVGLHSMRLVDGESKKLYAGTSDQNLTFVGATSEADSSPTYSSTNYVTNGTSLKTAIGALDSALNTQINAIQWKPPVATFASLPGSGNVNGDVRLVLDTRIIYSWNSTLSLWIPVSGSGGLIKVNYINPISTTLPTGPTVTIDGSAGVNGDLVLFTNLSSGNNQVYQLAGVGTSITWTAQNIFRGTTTPLASDAVIAQGGTAFKQQIAIFDGTNFLVNDKMRMFDGVSANFWEISSIKTSTLANNTSANVFSVAFSGSENIVVNYSILRGALKETGQLLLATNGTSVAITRTSANLGDTGITFTSQLNGANIELTYSSTNIGASATMKYYISRWSDSAGGPSGIPSYSGGGGGGTVAAGVTTDIQFNSAGTLGADSRFQWDSAAGALKLNNMQYGVLSSSITLNDNQISPASIISYNASSFPYAIIEYSVNRGSDYRVGRLLISNNGTNVGFNDDYVETSMTGISINASVSGANLVIEYTSTNTGNTASLKYSVRRWI